MKESEFVFDRVNLLYYKLHKISLNCRESYAVSPKWLKNKKETINPENNDNKCLQYAIALIHEQIKSHPERIQILSLLLINTIGKKIGFPSHKKDWKKFE